MYTCAQASKRAKSMTSTPNTDTVHNEHIHEKTTYMNTPDTSKYVRMDMLMCRLAMMVPCKGIS